MMIIIITIIYDNKRENNTRNLPWKHKCMDPEHFRTILIVNLVMMNKGLLENIRAKFV